MASEVSADLAELRLCHLAARLNGREVGVVAEVVQAADDVGVGGYPDGGLGVIDHDGCVQVPRGGGGDELHEPGLEGLVDGVLVGFLLMGVDLGHVVVLFEVLEVPQLELEDLGEFGLQDFEGCHVVVVVDLCDREVGNRV